MRTCFECGGSLYSGTRRAHADDFMCRVCQRSPAVQIRVFLARARAQEMEFDFAWTWAWERVRWPHDTTNRRDWKKVLGRLDVQDEFKSAYTRQVGGRSEAHLANLELVA